jgi:hypothetical protein
MNAARKIGTFVVTTKAEYDKEGRKAKQLSAVQSHVATLRHARNREQSAARSTPTYRRRTSETTVQRSVQSQQVPRLDEATAQEDACTSSQTPKDVVKIKITTKGDEILDQDLTLHDLLDIFGTEQPTQGDLSSPASGHLAVDQTDLVMEDNGSVQQRSRDAMEAYDRSQFLTERLCVSEHAGPEAFAPELELKHGISASDAFNSGSSRQLASVHAGKAWPLQREISSSVLNPFIRLPADITSPEQELMHFCESSTRMCTVP